MLIRVALRFNLLPVRKTKVLSGRPPGSSWFFLNPHGSTWFFLISPRSSLFPPGSSTHLTDVTAGMCLTPCEDTGKRPPLPLAS